MHFMLSSPFSKIVPFVR